MGFHRKKSGLVSEPEREVAELEKTLPLRHLGDVDDISNACIYLASDMGKFITGQMIHINGGEFMI